jgi:hypothetical protein
MSYGDFESGRTKYSGPLWTADGLRNLNLAQAHGNADRANDLRQDAGWGSTERQSQTWKATPSLFRVRATTDGMRGSLTASEL